MKTGGFKWWHGVVIAAAVAAVAWGGYSTFGGSGDRPVFATELVFVDVTTGDLFRFDVSGRRAVVVPEKNPTTGKATLLGAGKREDGKWYVSERHLPLLAAIEGDPGAVVDRTTGEVRVTSERPKPGR